MFTEQTDAKMAVIKVVSIWIFGIFSCYVREYGFSDLSRSRRRIILKRNNKTILDIQNSVGLDIFCRHGIGLDRTV